MIESRPANAAATFAVCRSPFAVVSQGRRCSFADIFLIAGMLRSLQLVG